jgi:hypothetical protein
MIDWRYIMGRDKSAGELLKQKESMKEIFTLNKPVVLEEGADIEFLRNDNSRTAIIEQCREKINENIPGGECRYGIDHAMAVLDEMLGKGGANG